MNRMIGLCAFGLLALPIFAYAFPFGGQASLVHRCYNQTIYVVLGPPIGGPYVWVAGFTKTYQFGPPAHSGQWLLGLAGAPYACVYEIEPLDVRAATAIIMMGSSQ